MSIQRTRRTRCRSLAGHRCEVIACSALALVEIIVALGIGSVVLLVTMMLFLYSGQSLAAISNYVALDSASRNALDRITKEIREALAMTSFQTNEVTLIDLEGQTLKYSHSPTTRLFTRERPIGATPQILLTECDGLEFQIFQRTPQAGTNSFTPTTDVSSCKMLSVNWRCSRVLMGARMNTERVQTAQIVLRNKP